MDIDDKVAIVVELGVLTRADGSASFTCKENKVLVAVHGPAPVKSKQERIDSATIQVTLEPLNSPPSLYQNTLALRLQLLLEKVILGVLHPRSLISIAVQPIKISQENNIFTTAFNACVAAILDAGVPLTCVPIAVELAGLEAIFSYATGKVTLLHQSISGQQLSLDKLDILLQAAEKKSLAVYEVLQSAIQKSFNTAAS